jgi:hypothetical protein
MFGSSILDVAIGMAVVYLILSLIASVVQEAIAAVLQSRSANLLQGLHSLFSGDKGPDGQTLLLSAVYDHGLIRGLYRDPATDSTPKSPEPKTAEVKASDKKNAQRTFDRIRMKMQAMLGLAPPKSTEEWIQNLMMLPAYIPSRTFALALIDILGPAESGVETNLDQLRSSLAAALKTDPGNKALQALSALADSAGKDIAEFQRRLENWYNDAMDRISGWYKKYTQNILMVIGLILAIAFNVSSIRVAKTLWTDKDAREAMVAEAKQYTAEGNPVSAQPAQGSISPTELATRLGQRISAVQDVTDQKLLPMGWNGPIWGDATSLTVKVWRVLLALLGWCITALALSLGASFWFDTLNKFMIIRGTIKPDEKSQVEPSKG